MSLYCSNERLIIIMKNPIHFGSFHGFYIYIYWNYMKHEKFVKFINSYIE